MKYKTIALFGAIKKYFKLLSANQNQTGLAKLRKNDPIKWILSCDKTRGICTWHQTLKKIVEKNLKIKKN
jgi:hypothetical protein